MIREIDRRLARELKRLQVQGAEEMRVIRDRRVHMANLAVYGSSFVNGVAAIHSEILKADVFREWYAVWPEKFQNKTNGITQRRWLGLCNPELCALLDDTVGEGYLTDLFKLDGLKDKIDDALAERFMAVKREKKRQLAAIIREKESVELPEHFIFSVQVKRLHEYKRQLLNALSIWDIYQSLLDGSLSDFPATAFIFGAKSAPGYARAKAVIRFINRIAAIINADARVNDRLRVVFVQNYNCSYAEHIIPAADISEQISPAGTEASGTGNMKLMMNGAVTIGTLDGANVEMFEQLGADNMFLFGLHADEAEALRAAGYDPQAYVRRSPWLGRVLERMSRGYADGESYADLVSSLLYGGDPYLLLADFDDYAATHERLYAAIADPAARARLSLVNIARSGIFAADRAVREYAERIWEVHA